MINPSLSTNLNTKSAPRPIRELGDFRTHNIAQLYVNVSSVD